MDQNALGDMWITLVADVMRSREEIEKSDTEEARAFWARIHTRAVFAAIEGTCEDLCRQAFVAECNKAAKGQISLGTLSVLAGETYFVNEKGEIQCQKLKTKFLHQVLLSLNSYAEAQEVNHRAKKGDAWHRILNAVRVRDRVTHPKQLTALTITNEEIEDVDYTLKWLFDQIASVLREKGCDVSPMPDLPWSSDKQ